MPSICCKNIITPLLAAVMVMGFGSAHAQQATSAGEFCINLTSDQDTGFALGFFNRILWRIEAVAASSKTLMIHGILQISAPSGNLGPRPTSRIHFTGTSTAMTNVGSSPAQTVFSGALHGTAEITDYAGTAGISGLFDAGNNVRTYTAQFAHAVPFDRNKSYFNDSLGGNYRMTLESCADPKYDFYKFNDTKPFFR